MDTDKKLKTFVKKLVTKGIILAFIFIILAAAGQAAPVLTNEMALTQMENSNAAFVLMETYNKIMPAVRTVALCAALFIVVSIGYDTYIFTKSPLTSGNDINSANCVNTTKEN